LRLLSRQLRRRIGCSGGAAGAGGCCVSVRPFRPCPLHLLLLHLLHLLQLLHHVRRRCGRQPSARRHGSHRCCEAGRAQRPRPAPALRRSRLLQVRAHVGRQLLQGGGAVAREGCMLLQQNHRLTQLRPAAAATAAALLARLLLAALRGPAPLRPWPGCAALSRVCLPRALIVNRHGHGRTAEGRRSS
jgi:hypothetical protein